MNIHLGMTRLLAVIWGLAGLAGVVFLGEVLFTAINRGRLDNDIFLSVGILVATYAGWRVSLWVLNGFFSGEKIQVNDLYEVPKRKGMFAFIPPKGIEYLKVAAFAIAVMVVGGVVTAYSDLIGAGILYIGLFTALMMAVRVFKGGKAFN